MDGGLGGLAAAWSASACQPAGAGQPVLILCTPPGPGGGFARRRAAVARQVQVCAVERAIELHLPEVCPDLLLNEPWPRSDAPASAPSEPLSLRALSHLLLDACTEAIKLDISRVIWPVHSGAPSDAELRPDAIADACDRSLLVGQLASLDAPRTGPGSRGVRLETPFADFTDLQLAELAIDLGVPLATCGWCQRAPAPASGGTSDDRPCGRTDPCPVCRRWNLAFKRAGDTRALAVR